MGAPAKFMFDMDFAAPQKAPEHTITEAEVADRIANAEARAYRAGFDAAATEARAESDRRIALAMEEINIAINSIAHGLNAVEARLEMEAVEVAVAIARRLCGQLIANEPMTEMMALVSDCLRHLTTTPHIVIRINDTIYDNAHERIERIAKQTGFQGRLVILAEPDVPNGDCKIEWADGGIVLDRGATEEKINELVSRYMAAREQAGALRH